MWSKAVVVAWLVVGVLGATAFVTRGDAASSRQTAIVRFDRPTWVTTEMLVGTYVIVHDGDLKAHGEPCTTFYRVGTRSRPLEEVVSFRCIPRERKVAQSLTLTVDSDPVSGVDTLIEYQLAGDSEGHGVPFATRWTSADRERPPSASDETR